MSTASSNGGAADFFPRSEVRNESSLRPSTASTPQKRAKQHHLSLMDAGATVRVSNETDLSDDEVDARDRAAFQANLRMRMKRCKKTGFLNRRHLDLGDLMLTADDIPVAEIRLLGVRRLTMVKNLGLKRLPESLVSGASPAITLRHLDVSSCRLSSLPERWELPNLETLDLSYNKIRDFPPKIVHDGSPKLRSLNLYGNKLMQMPCFSGDCSDPRGSFRSVGSATSRNRSVVQCCSHCHSWTGLKELNVGYNDLTSLPKELPDTLLVLIASNNFFTEVPAELILGQEASSLRRLDVTSNPIERPPIYVCNAGLKAMRRFLRGELKDIATLVATMREENGREKLEERVRRVTGVDRDSGSPVYPLRTSSSANIPGSIEFAAGSN